MLAVVFVVVAPCRNHAEDMAQSREQHFVHAFLSHPAVEALDQTVLHRLAGCDIVPFDVLALLPLECRVGCQLGSVVTDHDAGLAELPPFRS